MIVSIDVTESYATQRVWLRREKRMRVAGVETGTNLAAGSNQK